MSEIQKIDINAEFASFKIKTDIEDVSYILRFDWNTRTERWYIGIYDSDENAIQIGIPMNVDCDLISRFAETELPPGILILLDTSGLHSEAGRDDLGDRCVLLYQTSV